MSVGASVALLPSAGLVLAGGLLVGGLAVPALAALLGSRAARRQAAARGQLSAELIESLRGAPELVAFGADDAALDRVYAADWTLVKLARRDALTVGVGDGLELLVTGLTVAGVLAVAIAAHDHGALNRVLIATLGLLALAAFEAVTPLAATARELSATLAAGRRVLELTDHAAAVQDPARPAAAPQWPFAVALEDVTARYPREDMPAVDGVSLRLEPGERIALLGPSGAGKTTVANLLLRFLDPDHGQVTIAGRDRSRLQTGRRPSCDLGRRPGIASVLSVDPRQRPTRATGRERRRSSADALRRGADLGMDLAASRRARDARRRRGARALGRPAPAGPRSRGRSRRRRRVRARRADRAPRSRRPRASWSTTCSRPPATARCC